MAVSREQLVFDVLANTSRAESGFKSLGHAASASSDDVSGLARRLDEISKKSATARVALEGDKEAQAKLDRIDAKLISLDRRTSSAKISVEGAARATAEISAVDVELDKLSAKSAEAKTSTGLLAGLSGAGAGGAAGGMAALIAAGAALAPVIATLGVGLGGLGLAALAAGKNSKELQQEIAPLKQQFMEFGKELQPTLLADFAAAAQLAGHVLHDIEPVTLATGKALGGLFAAVDKEFQSGTWQQFFGFMAANAGPDIKLLGGLFVALLKDLPPLIEEMQPLAKGLLYVATDALKLFGALEKVHLDLPLLGAAIGAMVGGPLGALAGAAVGTAGDLVMLAQKASVMTGSIGKTGMALEHTAATSGRFGASLGVASGHISAAGKSLINVENAGMKAAKELGYTGDSAAVAGPKFFSLNKEVAALNNQMTKLVGNLLQLQGGELSWQQAIQSANAQLKSNTAGLEGNSKNALANRQAVLQSTNAAIAFASQQLTLGKNIDGADRTVRAQINWLQGLHDKSQFVRDELRALRREEALLAAQRIRQTIHVQGLGQWSVSQSLAPGAGHRRAFGGLIPGTGNADSYPALLTPGEVVVPRGMVQAGAVDHLRGRLPGFASGGIVPDYAGSVGGIKPWVLANDKATIRLIDQAVVKATVAGMRAAQAAAQGVGGTAGPGGGNAAANAALAYSLYASRMTPAMWAAWNYVAMRESGWNQFAQNPSSGAYGIPQALPFTKMPRAAWPASAGGSSNPMAQITWMWNYMMASYGGPVGAAAHEASAGWYGKGLKGGIFTHPTVIGVGDRPERVDITPLGKGGASLVHVDTMVVQDATDMHLVSSRLNFLLTSASLGP